MSKVALRVYVHQIEALIDQGHLEEAVAHCQHILKVYPKHLDTYRMMGKAYLEARRYLEAVDIFQRVLLTVPDDFVAHLGMSLIRDEQKDLDAAIWHMERAFETNPSNSGVTAELRRLYGRRDGLEPPKIRLTRGALAQMYTKGGQYNQAITEIMSVLSDDPTRADMKVLLAWAYFRNNQRPSAGDVCGELLDFYPHVFDANRIMTEILSASSRAETAEVYRKRVVAIDPYAGSASGSIFDADSVPDNAITLDRLDYDPDQPPAGWGQAVPAAAPQSGSKEEIPDWMKAQGWGPSTGEFQEGPVNFDEPAAKPSTGELAAAEIPDWLKSMAPPGAPATGGLPDIPASDEIDLDFLSGLGAPGQTAAESPAGDDSPDWLSGLGVSAGAAAAGAAWMDEEKPAAPAASGDVPDWLAGMRSESAPAAGPASSDTGAAPDWLSGLGADSVSADSGTPDWLSGLGAESTPETTSTPTESGAPDWLSGLGAGSTPETTSASSDSGAAPDWLSGLGAESTPETTSAPTESGAPDWLSGLGAESTPETTSAPTDSGAAPDWLSGLGAESTLETTSTPTASGAPDWLSGLGAESMPETTSAPTDSGAPDWLADLGIDHEPPTAPLPSVVTPSIPPQVASESLPDWLSDAESEEPSASAAAPAESGSAMDWLGDLSVPTDRPAAQSAPVSDWLNDLSGKEAFSPPVSGPGTTPGEQDDAMNWLESLAQKQGANPEELITRPEDRTEHRPDWVEQVSYEPPAAQEETPQPYIPETPIEAEAEPFSGELSPAAAGPGTSAPEQDDAMSWLEGLAEKQGANPEELITDAGQRREEAPEWVAQVENPQPDLSALISGPGTSSNEQDDAMNWLEMLAMKQGAKSEELITNPDERTEAAPDWVARVGEEPETVVPAPVAAEPEPVETPVTPQTPVAEEETVTDDLSALISGPGTSSNEQDDAMKWLEMLAMKQGAKSEELITKPDERTESAPEWVAKVGTAPETVISTPAAKPQASATEETESVGELSALISGPGTSSNEQDDAMKWLEMLAMKQGAKSEELITKPEERTESAPGWVAKVGEEPETVVPAPATPVEPPSASKAPVMEEPEAAGDLSALISGPGTSSNEQDDAMKWLEMLAMKQGAKSEELITNPDERTESAPEWVAQVGTAPETVISAPAAVEPPTAPKAHVMEEPEAAGDLSALISGPGTSSNEQDDAMKWLEMLAMKQGAKSEELITKPDERTESAPEWVAKVGTAPETVISTPAAAEPPTTPKAPVMEEPEAAGDLSAVISGPGTSSNEQDDAMKWLEMLAMKQGAKSEELITRPEERTESAPEWVARVGEEPETVVATPPAETPEPSHGLPEWMGTSEPYEPAVQPEQEAPVMKMPWETEETPVAMPWEKQPEPVAAQPAEDALPDWLTESDEEPVDEAPAQPVTPAPWEPEIVTEAPSLAVMEPPVEQEQPVAAQTENVEAWLQELDQQETHATLDDEPPSPVEPEKIAAPDEEIPEWVRAMSAPAATGIDQEGLPDWLKEKSSAPAAEVEWTPPQETAAPAVAEPSLTVEKPAARPEPVSFGLEEAPEPEKAVEAAPVSKPSIHMTAFLSDKDGPALQNAQSLLENGDLQQSMAEYGKIIKRGRLLEDVIFQLQDATYKHPVDVVVWQTLGDAFMRANRLQEALDAYTKAESLLR
jgi:tetratricopeptide (TPR) repeat protein/uncharacterized protein Smg (DUF494 family)